MVGYNGKKHNRAALAWGAEEATRRDAPLLVLLAANYPGMTVEPGPGLLERSPRALEAAEEVTARGVSGVLEAHPRLRIAGATEVTSPSPALTKAGDDTVRTTGRREETNGRTRIRRLSEAQRRCSSE